MDVDDMSGEKPGRLNVVFSEDRAEIGEVEVHAEVGAIDQLDDARGLRRASEQQPVVFNADFQAFFDSDVGDGLHALSNAGEGVFWIDIVAGSAGRWGGAGIDADRIGPEDHGDLEHLFTPVQAGAIFAFVIDGEIRRQGMARGLQAHPVHQAPGLTRLFLHVSIGTPVWGVGLEAVGLSLLSHEFDRLHQRDLTLGQHRIEAVTAHTRFHRYLL